MKRNFLIIVSIFSAYLLSSVIYPIKEDQGQYWYNSGDGEAFHVGDTLLPSEACKDTMIVINADDMNAVFDGVEMEPPSTDEDIFEALNEYCERLKQ